MFSQLDKQISTFKPELIRRYIHARFILCFALLLFAFLGIVLTDINKDWSWNYWKFTAPVFAINCIILSWLYPASAKKSRLGRVKDSVLHWSGLIFIDLLVVQFVSAGLMSDPVAGLVMLISLAFATFLTGIYFDVSFIFIGLLLGLFAEASAFFDTYLSFRMLPIALIVIGVMYFFYHVAKKKLKKVIAKVE